MLSLEFLENFVNNLDDRIYHQFDSIQDILSSYFVNAEDNEFLTELYNSVETFPVKTFSVEPFFCYDDPVWEGTEGSFDD
jgi:hypothetical protein